MFVDCVTCSFQSLVTQILPLISVLLFFGWQMLGCQGKTQPKVAKSQHGKPGSPPVSGKTGVVPYSDQSTDACSESDNSPSEGSLEYDMHAGQRKTSFKFVRQGKWGLVDEIPVAEWSSLGGMRRAQGSSWSGAPKASDPSGVRMMRADRLCWHFGKPGGCLFGDACSFAHGVHELRGHIPEEQVTAKTFPWSKKKAESQTPTVTEAVAAAVERAEVAERELAELRAENERLLAAGKQRAEDLKVQPAPVESMEDPGW